MTPKKAILAVEVGVPGTGAIRDEIRLKALRIVGEGSADDLLHPALVQINAGAEHYSIPRA
jgi:hypothetical protein